MRLAAVTKLKHGDLWKAMTQLGWTAAELSRRTGILQPTLGRTINLQRRPTAKQAEAIQKTFGAAGIYIDVLEAWPESFRGLGKPVKIMQFGEVDVMALSAAVRAKTLSPPEELERLELPIWAEDALSVLSPCERQVIELQCGLGDSDAMTQDQIGERLNIPPQTVYKIAKKATERMRYEQSARHQRYTRMIAAA